MATETVYFLIIKKKREREKNPTECHRAQPKHNKLTIFRSRPSRSFYNERLKYDTITQHNKITNLALIEHG